MSKKKLSKSESVVEVPAESVESSAKKSVSSKSKKVDDVALEEQLSELEKSLLAARESLVAASSENERLADELGVSVAENKQLRKELQKIKQDSKKLLSEKNANDVLVDELHNELVRSKTHKDELMATIGRLQDKVKEYAKELETKDFEIGTLQAELADHVASSAVHDWGFWKRLLFAFRGKSMLK